MRLVGLAELLAQPPLARVLAVLNDGGEEARVVGGAVRNTLLGLPNDDVDLATTALPAAVMKRAKRAGFGVVPTGVAHGTVTLLHAGTSFEVTTLRRDVETDGRHAAVAFGRSFEEDAQRRDFTINALSLSPDGTLHDTVCGLADLDARRVRFIGDARERIREDYLRILRLFRFHAAFGEGALEPDARDAAIAGRAGLRRLSAERINGELRKLLIARRAPSVVAEMGGTGLLGSLLGAVPRTDRFARAVFLAPEADTVTRLAALAVTVAEDAALLRFRLKLSNKTTRRLEAIAAVLQGTHRADPAGINVDALLYRVADHLAVSDALLIGHASSGLPSDNPEWTAARQRATGVPIPTLPVSGGDLVGRGLAPGRAVGVALKHLQARWIRAGFPRDPAVLARLVDEVVSQVADDGSGEMPPRVPDGVE